MSNPDYKAIDKDTAEWHELSGKEKIEWILFKSMRFSDYGKTDIAVNVIHACYRHYEMHECTYEEALETMVVTFHGQVNDLVRREIERASLNVSPSFIIGGQTP